MDDKNGASKMTAFQPGEAADADAFAELSDLFAEEDERTKKSEQSVLTQNLEGFASCFPDWDLHPPVE